jgi:hypothetical protein
MTYDKRFYGVYQGICVDVNDPQNSSRIKLQIPQVLGTEYTNWAEPSISAGLIAYIDGSTSSGLNGKLSAPYIGQHVWVMFIAGDPNFPVWIGVRP